MTSPAEYLPKGVVPLDRDQIAARIASDIPEGWFVNLGIGFPTQIANHVPSDREVVFHSENGILGVGEAPAPDAVQPWLVNAGKQHVTLTSGGSYFHHADSFAMIRGGHLDLCVLGAYEVAQNGDIANWITLDRTRAPAVGGAMDLSAGARRLWVATDHIARSGAPKLVDRCTYPLTAPNSVQRVYSDLAIIDITPKGFEVREMVPGMTLEALQAVTGAPLHLMEAVAS